MKPILLLLSLFFTLSAIAQKKGIDSRQIGRKAWDFVLLGYTGRTIVGQPALGTLHGINFSAGTRFFRNRLAVGIETMVVSRSEDQRINWQMNGMLTPADLSYSDHFTQTGIYARWYFRDRPGFNPYLMAGAGRTNWSSSVGVYDPNDEDHCTPFLESYDIVNSSSHYTNFGAGLVWSTGWFLSEEEWISTSLDFSVRYVQTGNMDVFLSNHQKHGWLTNEGSQPFNGQFVDTRTNTLHSHQLGTLVPNTVLRNVTWQITWRMSYANGKSKKKRR